MSPAPAAALSTAAHGEILDRLLDGRLAPGDPLNRRQLADQLAMSVAPVLEAFVRLEQEGFLETLPRKGTRVRLVRLADVTGQLCVREALECQAARQACGQPLRAQRGPLLALARKLDGRSPGEPTTWRLDIAFHSALVAAAGIAELTQAHARTMRLGLFMAIHAAQASRSGERDEVPRSLHRRLLDRLCRCGPEEAESAMRAHLRRGREALLGTLR